MTTHFTLEYWKDEDWYVGRLKQDPGIFSQGKTLSELESNIRDAYQLMKEDESAGVPSANVKTEELRIAVRSALPSSMSSTLQDAI